MAADRVEREILIEASVEVVWRAITEPEHISRWFSDDADVHARAGARGSLTWKPGGRGGRSATQQSDWVAPIRVVDAEPFRRFSFRWNHPEGSEPVSSNSALVEFILAEESGGTRLTVVESGIGAVARDEDGRARYLEDHAHGWEKHLGELRGHVAAAAHGTAR
jgi:uncharacterized protein YndB with AHSA1/START domain